MTTVRCFHCADPVVDPERWTVSFEQGAQPVCCPGCQAVATAILDAGLDDYYRQRTTAAVRAAVPDNLTALSAELAVYDEPEVQSRFVETTGDSSSPKQACVSLAIQGMHCGACVWLLERTLSRQAGVRLAAINFSTERARIHYDPATTTLARLLASIQAVGYRAFPYDANDRENALRIESRAFLQRLFLAGLGMTQVMMYALPHYLSTDGDLERPYEQLLRWASLVLTTPVVLYSAQPFLRGAWRDLRSLRPGMDVPVTIGLLAAYGASVAATIQGTGQVYFDSVSMFVFLLLGARYLEWTTRRRAIRAIDSLGSAQPETALLLAPDQTVQSVPAARLKPGDLIRVDNGARVPVDGVLTTGRGALDLSLLTGESTPVPVAAGAHIAGGALVAGSALTLRVVRPQRSSTLSIIEQLVERSGAEKPRLASLADRAATVFVTALLCVAGVVYAYWWQHDATRAASIAIAVLVVSCPCALSLATPAALAASTAQLLRRHLLITRGSALETLAHVTDVVFDKTGTLTRGQPIVTRVDPDPVLGQATLGRATALALAAELETGSSHPFALALQQAAQQNDGDPATVFTRLHDHINESGHGVAAFASDTEGQPCALRLGSRLWCKLSRDSALPAASGPVDTGSEVYLSVEYPDQPVRRLARFQLHDPIRADARAVIDQLVGSGIRTHMLSGDREAPVTAVANALGIEAYRAGQTPEDKKSYVRELQQRGAIVMMVGDGINDAPVLAGADVSLAVGKATSLARTAADIIALAPGIDSVSYLLDSGRTTLRVIRQNLAWAALYNIVAIPAAASGWIPPWLAAIGMATSSLLVAVNATRLYRPVAPRRKVRPSLPRHEASLLSAGRRI